MLYLKSVYSKFLLFVAYRWLLPSQAFDKAATPGRVLPVDEKNNTAFRDLFLKCDSFVG